METQVLYDNTARVVMTERRNPVIHQLCVKVGTCIRFIEMVNIVYVRAAGNYVGIVMVSGETVHTKATISHIAERLPDHMFVKIHRSYIVNLACIKEIKPRQNNYEFTLSGNIRLLSGTTYRKLIHKRFSVNSERAGKFPASQPASDDAAHHSAPAGSKLEGLTDVKTHIRACTPGDEDGLAFFDKITFMKLYTGKIVHEDTLAHTTHHDVIATYRDWLKNPTVRVWIVETEPGNVLVGCLVLAPPVMPFAEVHNDDLEIHRMYLLESFWFNGVGKQLISQAVQHAKQAGYHRLLLGDHREKRQATAFYEQLGFRYTGEYLCNTGNRNHHDIVFSLEIG